MLLVPSGDHQVSSLKPHREQEFWPFSAAALSTGSWVSAVREGRTEPHTQFFEVPSQIQWSSKSCGHAQLQEGVSWKERRPGNLALGMVTQLPLNAYSFMFAFTMKY